MPSARTSRRAAVALLLAAAAAIRLSGIATAPPTPDEASLLHRTALVWHGESSERARLPRLPSLGVGVHVAAQAAYFTAGSAVGQLRGRVDFASRLEEPARGVLVFARVVSVVFGTAAVALLLAFGASTLGFPAALAGGVLLAFDPLAVALSARATDGAIFVTALLVALLALERLRRSPSPRSAFLAGFAIGIAAAVHYAGALLLVPLVALEAPRRRAGAGALSVAVPAALLAFLVGSPLVLLDAGRSIETARLEMLRLSGGLGATRHAAALTYARTLLPRALGWPALALSLAGIVWLAFRRSRALAAAAMFAVLYGAAIGVWRVAEIAALLPLVPLLGLAAGAAAVSAGARVARGATGACVAGAVLVAVAASPIGPDLARRGHARTEGDTRENAAKWIRASLPAQASFALEAYGPTLHDGLGVIYRIPFQAVDPRAYNHAYHLDWYRGFDYIVVSEAIESRYAAEPLAFQPEMLFYLQLSRDGDPVKSFEAGRGTGPAIAIYKLREKSPSPPGLDSLLASTPPTPQMAGFLTGLGVAYAHMGRLGAAIPMQKKALEIAPGEPRIYATLGASYIEAGQPEAALEVLKDAVGRFPDNVELRYNLGKAYRSKGLDERAVLELENAVRMKPDFADAHLELGQAYAKVGRYPEAAAALEEYLRLSPGAPRADEVRDAIRYLRSHPAPVVPAGRE